VVTCDAAGRVTARYAVGTANMAYETPAATWHTVIVAVDGAAFLEVKQGPHDPATMSEFAAWASVEGDPAVAHFQQWLRTGSPGESLPDAKPA